MAKEKKKEWGRIGNCLGYRCDICIECANKDKTHDFMEEEWITATGGSCNLEGGDRHFCYRCRKEITAV